MIPKSGNKGAFTTRVFAASIPPAGAVVDASAGAGRHTMIAAHAVGPRGQVMAFEPEPESYRALRANVREHGFEDRVTALPLGTRGTGRGCTCSTASRPMPGSTS